MSTLDVALSSLFTPISAMSFLVFTLLYTPCIAAVATLKRELESTFATIGVVVLQCFVAWVCAWVVFTVGGSILCLQVIL